MYEQNNILPFAIPITKAHNVLGIGRTTFEKHIRPMLIIIPMGSRRLVDIIDLQQAWEQYKEGCIGQPKKQENDQCKKSKERISTIKASMSSTSAHPALDFTKRLDTAKAKKRA